MNTAVGKKKQKISKSKLKKTIKNVLCRPDPVFWPLLANEESADLEDTIKVYKVDVPVYNKPLWAEIKDIPKDQRPKPPKISKVEGLVFGLTSCCRSVQENSASGVVIDADVNPRILVQELLETCILKNTPVLCIKDLKRITKDNFGFSSCCLAVQNNIETVSDLRCKIMELAKNHIARKVVQIETAMECDEEKRSDQIKQQKLTPFQYLHRTSKKSRTFVPGSQTVSVKSNFGHDFIELPQMDKTFVKHSGAKSYMNMIVKRISGNQNRVKNK